MLVHRTNGLPVYLVANKKGVLVDSDQHQWKRKPEWDTPERAAFASEDCSIPDEALQLDCGQLRRVVAGDKAIQRVLSVDEFYAHIEIYGVSEVSAWNDQRVREALIAADEAGTDVIQYLARSAKKEATEDVVPQEAPEDVSPTPDTTEHHGDATETKRKHRRPAKVQPGGFECIHDGARVVLTPRQTEFMERLSELEDWDVHGVRGSYVLSDYVECLNDTMNPMAVGAMVSTLCEKHVVTMVREKVDGAKRCVFSLTPLGVAVYEKISKGEVCSE